MCNPKKILWRGWISTKGPKPQIPKVKDTRRYFLTELDADEQKKIVCFFDKNKLMIIHDVLRGDIVPKADYILVVKKNRNN